MSGVTLRGISLTGGIAHILYSILDPNLLRKITLNYKDILRLSYECEFYYLLFDHLACRIMDITSVT
jgi:hypothetical protein